jgi:hypothetical protein
METIKAVDLTQIHKEHENRWVAISPEDGRVLAVGDTLKEVRVVMSEKRDSETPVFFRVLSPDLNFAPIGL